MTNWCFIVALLCIVLLRVVFAKNIDSDPKNTILPWEKSLENFPTSSSPWLLEDRIPMTEEFGDYSARKQGTFKVKKKLKQFIMPLLLAYKLKFFTLIPILVGGLLLLVGSTGMAGFFFALFAASMGLKTGGYN